MNARVERRLELRENRGLRGFLSLKALKIFISNLTAGICLL
jgi:hypothetical protein